MRSLVAAGLAAAALVGCRATPDAAPAREPAFEPDIRVEPENNRIVVSGRLDDRSRVLAGTAPHLFDRWPYEGVEGELIQVTMRSAELDAHLKLLYRDENTGRWIELSHDDDSGGGHDARFAFELPFDGTFYLLATTASPEMQGRYELEIDSAPPLSFAAKNATRSGRYAVLVGIEDYPGQAEDLDGPSNDVEIFRAMLSERFGFREEDVIELRDARATRKNVIAAFKDHLGRAQEGDVAVFYYSGHGLRTSTNLGLVGAADEEEDGRDEALYLADGSLLLDDELGFLVDRVNTDKKLLVLDSCFSGTGTRGPKGFSKRVRVEDVEDALWLPEHFLVEGRTPPPTRNLERMLGEGGPIDHVLLASSSEDQVSWTLPASSEENEIPCSAFTYSVVQFLSEAVPGATFAELMVDIRDFTEVLVSDAHGEEQHPRAEGRPAGESALDFLGGPTGTLAKDGAER